MKIETKKDVDGNLFSGKRILVTGGAGAIGSNLVRELLKHNCRIVILDDLSSGYMENVPKNGRIEFVRGSITDEKSLNKAFSKKIHIVFHLAAFFANQNSVEHPDTDLMTNGYGTLSVLQHALNANVERFVYTSSSCVYGDVQIAAIESHKDYHLDTPYAITKLLGEYYVKYYHDYHHLPVVILRIFNSYGPGERPGQYRNVIPNFLWRVMHNKPLIIYGTGEETRDFNWVGNTVQALLFAAIKKEAVGETFNVGSGEEVKINDLAKTIFKVIGKPENIVRKDRRAWDTILRRKSNIEKTKNILGYAPDIKNFEDKIRQTYNWMKTVETKKILIISPRQWDLQWGQEKDLINTLNTSYEVILLELLDYNNLPETYKSPDRTTLVKRKTKHPPGLALGFITEWRNLKDVLRYRSDIFITYLTAGSLLATIAAKLKGEKIILIYADDMPELHRGFSYIGYIMTKYFFNPVSALLANRIVATSRLLAKDISLFGKKAEYIPNGVDLHAYTLRKEQDASTKGLVKKGKYTVCYVGSFGDWVDFDLLLASAQRMKETEFLLVGDGAQFAEIKEKTKNMKNVTLTGMLPKEKVIGLLNSVDVCTIPFRVNRLTDRVSPIKLFEYWAMKKPVVCTSFYEVKKTGRNIVLFADTKEQFHEALVKLKNKKLREALGEKGRVEVDKYDWQRLSSQYYDIIDAL